MQRTRIKLCGMTRMEDARLAVKLGADAIGLFLHGDSKRLISIERAREIIAALPPFVTAVGLFVDAPVVLVRETAQALGLSHVQLHGRETPEMIRELSGLSVIKAIHVKRGTLEAELDRWRAVINLHGLLLETGGTNQAGGSGIANDWQTILETQRAGIFEGLPPVIAAGGLRPETVGDVVRLLHPWAVDVSSGIESSPGIKSEAKMREFVRAVREAET